MRTAIMALVVVLAGCGETLAVRTETIEKPYPVYCEPPMPGECKDRYPVDRVSEADDPVTINRAMQAELEERAACEAKLKAALRGCGRPR